MTRVAMSWLGVAGTTSAKTNRMRVVSWLTVLTAFATPLSAQTDTLLTKAAAAITTAEITRHLAVLGADSMLRRDTPSQALERTARYVEGELKKLPRRPGDSVWMQRYPIPGNLTLDYAETRLKFTAMLLDVPIDLTDSSSYVDVKFSFTSHARFAVDTVPSTTINVSRRSWMPPKSYLVSGWHTDSTLQAAGFRDRMLLYVPPAGIDSAALHRVVERLRQWNYVVVLADESPDTFAARRHAATQRPRYVEDANLEIGVRYWAVFVQPAVLARILAVTKIDLAKLRASAAPGVRELISLRVDYNPTLATTDTDPITAPNVLARFGGEGPIVTRTGRGGNSREVDEFIVITARMDGPGTNGDNAAGLAALIEVARAWSEEGGRPRRGVVFLATSGSQQGFWGSAYALTHLNRTEINAAVNLDNVGRGPAGVVAIDGMTDFTFTKRPQWVPNEHPELELQIVDGGTVVNMESDHISFVRKTIPTLYIHDPADSALSAAPDVDHLTRVARLTFYLGNDLGQMPAPVWTSDGRRNRELLADEFGS